MFRSAVATSVMGSMLAIWPAPAGARPQPAGQDTVQPVREARTIRVTGRATVTSRPDRATVDIGVSSRAPASRDAVTANARQVNAVLAALRSLGAEVTTETVGYAVSPEHEHDERSGRTKLTGYRALTMLRAAVGDLGLVGDVIDTATKAGANEVAGVRFTLKNEQAARRKALQEASADARAKAEALASALGLRLSGVLSVSESEPFVRPLSDSRLLAAETSAMAPPLPPAAVDIEAVVVLTMEIAR